MSGNNCINYLCVEAQTWMWFKNTC